MRDEHRPIERRLCVASFLFGLKNECRDCPEKGHGKRSRQRRGSLEATSQIATEIPFRPMLLQRALRTQTHRCFVPHDSTIPKIPTPIPPAKLETFLISTSYFFWKTISLEKGRRCASRHHRLPIRLDVVLAIIVARRWWGFTCDRPPFGALRPWPHSWLACRVSLPWAGVGVPFPGPCRPVDPSSFRASVGVHPFVRVG